jgi:cysteine desulfurase
MLPYLTHCFGNPSSDSSFARPCRLAVVEARRRVAAMVGCGPDEVIFTSCGTESDNAAVLLALRSAPPSRWPGQPPRHVVTTNVEHPAIDCCLASYEAMGLLRVTRVAVGDDGVVDAEAVLAAIRPGVTVLVTVMHSNNEVGSINPVATIAAGCRARGVLCHTDAAQSCGKVRVDARELGVDMLTVVGHKFGAPKGVGALIVRDGCLAEHGRAPPPQWGHTGSLLIGGGQEGGKRGGTESVLLIAGLGAAAAIVNEELDKTHAHMARLRSLLESLLVTTAAEHGLPPPRVNGPADASKRLPNTLSVSFKGVHADQVLHGLRFAVSASAGSACHTGGGVSKVLLAMRVPSEYVRGTLRLSVGRHTTEDDVRNAARYITAAVRAASAVAAGEPIDAKADESCALM